MGTRIPTFLSALSITALLVWIVAETSPGMPESRGASAPGGVGSMANRGSEGTVERPGPPTQERFPGSEVPCAIPLAWRVARVDPEFGIDEEEATRIVSEAARLWEEGVGRTLFTHDPVSGFPIRLVYDERQSVLAERQSRTESLDSLGARLDREREELALAGERLVEDVAEHRERATELERRVVEHNATIREWNRTGDITDELRQQLEEEGLQLQGAQAQSEAERRALGERQADLESVAVDLQRRSGQYQELANELAAAFPPSEVEAGEYREAVRRQDGELVSVSREIRLYRFASADELRLVAAHELGHALGLGHIDDELGVMSARARSDRPVRELTAGDAALLQATCPA